MFSWLKSFQNEETPKIRHNFGRFISYSKTNRQNEQYEESKKAFKEQRYIEGYEHYFNYLNYFDLDNKSCENIHFKKDDNSLFFEIIQGSAIVKGIITPRHLRASVRIAHTIKGNIAVMRHLLEKNYMYTYTTYFLEDEMIKSKIYSDNISLSPQKIFFPLRELAVNSDKEKELLLDEFNDLEGVELEHIATMDSHLKETKLRFFREWIDKTEQNVALMPTQEQSGAIAFVWLGLLLKIDYFVTPRGKLGFDIYEAVSEYYLEDNKLVEEKNDALEKAVEKLKELDTLKLSKNLYEIKQTFDIFNTNTLEEIRSFINETLAKAIWYKEHKYEEIMLSIYEYLGLYMLYNFGMNECLRELTQLNVRLHNTDFHSALGYPSLFENESLNKTKVNMEIQNILSTYKKQYPHLENIETKLNYDSIEKFHHSYFLALNNLNFSEL